MPFYIKTCDLVSFKPIFIAEEISLLARVRGALIGDISKTVVGNCIQYYFFDGSFMNSQILAVVITFVPSDSGGVVSLNISSGSINPGFSTESNNVEWYYNWIDGLVLKCNRMSKLSNKAAQQVDSAEDSTIAVPPSKPSGSPR